MKMSLFLFNTLESTVILFILVVMPVVMSFSLYLFAIFFILYAVMHMCVLFVFLCVRLLVVSVLFVLLVWRILSASISGPAWTSIFRPLVRPKRGSFPLAHLSPSAPTGSIQSPGIGTPGTPVLWTSPRTTLSGGNRPRQS